MASPNSHLDSDEQSQSTSRAGRRSPGSQSSNDEDGNLSNKISSGGCFVRLMIHGRVPSANRIWIDQQATFGDVSTELATIDSTGEFVVLQPTWGPKPHWTRATPELPVGRTCRVIHAVFSNQAERCITGVVRTSLSDYPIVISESEVPSSTTFSQALESLADLTGKIKSITRYSDDKDMSNDQINYEDLAGYSSSTFSTAIIITIDQPTDQFKSDPPYEPIPAFLQATLIHCTRLLKRSYDLKTFALQMIHLSHALLHILICLANQLEPIVNNDNPDIEAALAADDDMADVVRMAPVISRDIQELLDAVDEIMDAIESESLDRGEVQRAIREAFDDICGEYPGAVNVRHSYKLFEGFALIDREEEEAIRAQEALRAREEPRDIGSKTTHSKARTENGASSQLKLISKSSRVIMRVFHRVKRSFLRRSLRGGHKTSVGGDALFSRSLGGPMNADDAEVLGCVDFSEPENRVHVENLSHDVKDGMGRDYGLTGLGEMTLPVEPVDRFNFPPLTRSSLLAEPYSVGSGGDRRDEAFTREPRRKALLIGILYTNEADPDWTKLDTPYEDVKRMKAFLKKNGYSEESIMILSDCEDADELHLGLPSREGILAGIAWLVKDVQPGDYLFLHYSGHASQIEADNYLELDGLDEVIVPLNSSKNYLTDNELYNLLVEPLPVGCKFMAVWDCSHAGTMLDLPFEHDPSESRSGSQTKAPGGPSNRYKMETAPRKTTYPPPTDRIKIVKTVKRSSTSQTHDSYELRVSHPGPIVPRNTKPGSVVPFPQSPAELSAFPPVGFAYSDEPQSMPSCTSTRTTQPRRFSPMGSNSTEDGASSRNRQVFTDDTVRRSSPEPISPVNSIMESTFHEGLHFFTSRAKEETRRRQTFGLPDHQPKLLPQVISIAACHDDQSIFEITLGNATLTDSTKSTGGLLTTTFIEFMEQDSQQKTLDDMLHYLSEAFIRETKRMHSLCCSCGNQCDREDCKIPKDKASARKGQCVYRFCPIPTIPPNPLVSTLTDKRRETLITV